MASTSTGSLAKYNIDVIDWAYHPKNKKSPLQQRLDQWVQEIAVDSKQSHDSAEHVDTASLLIRVETSMEDLDPVTSKSDDVVIYRAENNKLVRVWDSGSSATSRSASPSFNQNEESASDSDNTTVSSPIHNDQFQGRAAPAEAEKEAGVVSTAMSRTAPKQVIIICPDAERIPNGRLVMQPSMQQVADSIDWDQLVDNLTVIFNEYMDNPPEDESMTTAEVTLAKALFGPDNLPSSRRYDAVALANCLAPFEFKLYQKRADAFFNPNKGGGAFVTYYFRLALIHLVTKIEDHTRHKQRGWNRLIKAVADGLNPKALHTLRDNSRTIFDPYYLPILFSKNEEEAFEDLAGLVIATRSRFRAKYIDEKVKRAWKRKHPNKDCVRTSVVLRIRYSDPDFVPQCKVDDVPYPTFVFELGSLEFRSDRWASRRFEDILYEGFDGYINKRDHGSMAAKSDYLVCVDLEHPDRPLWLVRDSTAIRRPAEWNDASETLSRSPVFDKILSLDQHGPQLVLLMKKFPQSADEWEQSLFSQEEFVVRCREKAVAWTSLWIEPMQWPNKRYDWQAWQDRQTAKAEKKYLEYEDMRARFF